MRLYILFIFKEIYTCTYSHSSRQSHSFVVGLDSSAAIGLSSVCVEEVIISERMECGLFSVDCI